MLWFAGRRHIHDASPIVADAEKQPSGTLPDNEAYTGGHGVPQDIRHRLLNDAQNGSLQIKRQVVYRAGDPYGGFEAGAPAEAINELSQRRSQPLTFEIGRMEEIRKNPKFPEGLVQRCLNVGGHLPDGRIAVRDGGDL